MMIKEVGVLYTHDVEAAAEYDGVIKPLTYRWLHLETGTEGKRLIWVAAPFPKAGLAMLLGHWNRDRRWKYWVEA